MRLWLREKRQAGNLTQERLSKAIGISRVGYTNIENGRRDPSVATAKKIGLLLDFEWETFFEEESK